MECSETYRRHVQSIRGEHSGWWLHESSRATRRYGQGHFEPSLEQHYWAHWCTDQRRQVISCHINLPLGWFTARNQSHDLQYRVPCILRWLSTSKTEIDSRSSKKFTYPEVFESFCSHYTLNMSLGGSTPVSNPFSFGSAADKRKWASILWAGNRWHWWKGCASSHCKYISCPFKLLSRHSSYSEFLF